MLNLSRRKFFGQAATLILSPRTRWLGANAGLETQAVPPRSYAEELPDMFVSYLANKTNAISAQWDGERSKIRTAADLEARNRFVREMCL